MKSGRIITPPDSFIEKYESIVANILARNGKEIEFLTPSNTPGVRTPDVKMDGIHWEIKSPRGKSSRTLENNIRAALRQSANIIIFLGRIKLPESRCLTEINRQFKMSRKIKRILIITKSQKVLELRRKT